ncbi:MAG TPA: hypothetical protein VM736_09650, partial [Gemmatimonadales bacterium]|nr:hypothetical protein [Gemmatimonadales bacterium]
LAAAPAADPVTPSNPGAGDGSKLHAAEPATRSAASRPGPASAIVFVLRHATIVPVAIGTGLTDQDYTEVTSGLAERDTVLVLTGGGAR